MAKKNMTNKTGNFFIQLATVVIGIVITFGGSWLIQKSAERKQTVQILSMVRDELSKNFTNVGLQRTLTAHEYAGTKAMNAYIKTPALMPADSLLKYADVLMNVRSYVVYENSLEVLKSSSQIQTIRNKELIRSIFMVYENLNTLYANVQGYNGLKERSLNDYLSSVDGDILDTVYKHNVRSMSGLLAIFADLTKNSLMRNYIILTASGNNVAGIIYDADRLSGELTEVIDMIDKEIKH